MPKFKFIGRITDMGDKEIIIIPKEFRKDSKPFKHKQVRVQVDDEI
jgi:hypothetical protein